MSQFTNLRRDKDAPHKPILLLAVLNQFKEHAYPVNRIEVTPELLMEFKRLWSILVHDSRFKPNFALPFYHLKSSSFWRLIPRLGQSFAVTSSHSIRSMSALLEALDYVELDPELFFLLKNLHSVRVLQAALLERYFQNHDLSRIEGTIDSEIQVVSSEILSSSGEEYRKKIESLIGKLPKEEAEELIFVRGGIFKREIPRIYHYRCAISGMQIETKTQAQLIDACHIVPFSVSKDDTITNGISLCPNLHRAFDRGLISITDDYRVKVSKALKELDSPFSIRQFDGREIFLPNKTEYRPSKESLGWHRKMRFIFD